MISSSFPWNTRKPAAALLYLLREEGWTHRVVPVILDGDRTPDVRYWIVPPEYPESEAVCFDNPLVAMDAALAHIRGEENFYRALAMDWYNTEGEDSHGDE